MALEKDTFNRASLWKIEVVPEEDILNYPPTYNGKVLGTVTLQEGKSWEPLYFTLDTAHLVERPIVVNGAEAYESKVIWRVPKDDATKLEWIERHERKRFVAKLTDLNKVTVLMGSPDEPARLVMTLRDKGQSVQDSNHYVIEIKVTRGERVAILSS